MVQTLEAIKGGCGSVRVGTRGTISSLMTKELDSVKPDLQTPVYSRQKTRTVPVSVSCGNATPKRTHARKSLDEAGSSSHVNSLNRSTIETGRNLRSNSKNNHRIPMLASHNNALNRRTPNREKNIKKVSNIVEVVDIKCGNQERAWTSPITSRLKKLGFSKLSESII